MTDVKLSIAEIIEIAKAAKKQGIDSGLPSSKPGVADRAEKQGWKFETAPARGGKNGVKKVYTLPPKTIAELERKGLLHLLQKSTDTPNVPSNKPFSSYLKKGVDSGIHDVPEFMREMVSSYGEWAQEQDTDLIVPVRYHTNVFGSAGNSYELMENVNTEAMWFRRSFFNALGVPPELCFCTRVKGDSMFPTLTDRGTAMWQMITRYVGEDIYFFRQVNELRIKRLQQINSFTFRIISDNPNKDIYPTIDLDLRDMADHEFEIYGRYLWDCAIRS